MTKALFRLVALPALVAISCGGAGSDPADMNTTSRDLATALPDLHEAPRDLSAPSSDLSVPSPDLSVPSPDLSVPSPDLSKPSPDLGGCTGTPIYRLMNGVYPAIAGTGVIISDTCLTGLMSSELESARQVQNDGAGNITLMSSDASFIYGTGPVRCNAGTLVYGPVLISDGVCRFTANYSTDFTVTADNTFKMVLTQTRTSPTSEPGMICAQPSTCAVKFSMNHKL